MSRIGWFLVLCLLCGCATAFSSRENKRQYLNIPDKIALADEHGDAVPVYRQFDRYFVLPGKQIHELSFYRKDQKYFVPLHRKPSFLLFLDACAGYPMVIDDASDSWYYYPDIQLDTVKNSVPTFQESGLLRPFLGAGIGFSIHTTPQKYDFFHFEVTLGARMAQPYFLFLRYETAGPIAVAYDSNFRSGAESLLTLGLKWYPVGGLYLTTGGALMRAYVDTSFNNQSRYTPVETSTPTVMAGIGWSGEFSYIEVRQHFGLHSIEDWGRPAQYFNFTYVWGVNFEL